jgi:hypothetical protein
VTGDGDRPIRVRANESLVPRIARSERGSTIVLALRDPFRVHQSVRLELGLGPFADEIMVDAVVRAIRPGDTATDPPEVTMEIIRAHEERFAYVHGVITGQRDIVTRRHRRVAARVPVVWMLAGRSHRSFTGDIGCGGTFILGEEAPPPGAHIELDLHVSPRESLALRGIVTWSGVSRGDTGFGIKFESLDHDTFARLREIVRAGADP